MAKVTIYRVGDQVWQGGVRLCSAVADDLPKTYRMNERNTAFGFPKLVPKSRRGVFTDPQEAIDYYIEGEQMTIGSLEDRILDCRKNIQAAEELVVPGEEG